MGFPGSSSGKEPAPICKRGGFDPWVRKIPEGGHGKPLQYSCLENPMDRGGWQAAVHEVAKSWTWLSNWTHTHTKRRSSKCDLLVTPSRIDGQCPINECFHVWAVKQILTLNGIKNVMTTNNLKSLQGKTTPQWVIKIPEWFQRSGRYGIVGKILVARLYMCVWAGTWYQMCFLVNPYKEALSLSHRRGKWNSDRKNGQPKATELKALRLNPRSSVRHFLDKTLNPPSI